MNITANTEVLDLKNATETGKKKKSYSLKKLIQ